MRILDTYTGTTGTAPIEQSVLLAQSLTNPKNRAKYLERFLRHALNNGMDALAEKIATAPEMLNRHLTSDEREVLICTHVERAWVAWAYRAARQNDRDLTRDELSVMFQIKLGVDLYDASDLLHQLTELGADPEDLQAWSDNLKQAAIRRGDTHLLQQLKEKFAPLTRRELIELIAGVMEYQGGSQPHKLLPLFEQLREAREPEA
jgi:hypothetical protein